MEIQNSLKLSRILIILACLLLVFSQLASYGQADSRLEVAVTIPGMVSIVKYIGGEEVEVVSITQGGSFPRSYTLSDIDTDNLEQIDLLVCGNSEAFSFENELLQTLEGVETVDWPDYESRGARLEDFPGWDNNPHGFWTGFGNAKAVAAAVAEALMIKGANAKLIAGNLARFVSEVDALEESGRQLISETGRERSAWVAIVPEVTYAIDNLGLEVGAVAYSEATGLASGYDLQTIRNELSGGGRFAGIVCPMGMENLESIDLARSLSEDTGAPVCYVRVPRSGTVDSFTADAAFNAGAIAVGAVKSEVNRSTEGMPVSGHLVWALIVFGLLIAIVMQNRRMYGVAAYIPPPEKKKKK